MIAFHLATKRRSVRVGASLNCTIASLRSAPCQARGRVRFAARAGHLRNLSYHSLFCEACGRGLGGTRALPGQSSPEHQSEEKSSSLVRSLLPAAIAALMPWDKNLSRK